MSNRDGKHDKDTRFRLGARCPACKPSKNSKLERLKGRGVPSGYFVCWTCKTNNF